MSESLVYRTREWPLHGIDQTVALTLAQIADENTRATKAIDLNILAVALEMPRHHLDAALLRLEAIGALDRITNGAETVFILAPSLPPRTPRCRGVQG